MQILFVSLLFCCSWQKYVNLIRTCRRVLLRCDCGTDISWLKNHQHQISEETRKPPYCDTFCKSSIGTELAFRGFKHSTAVWNNWGIPDNSRDVKTWAISKRTWKTHLCKTTLDTKPRRKRSSLRKGSHNILSLNIHLLTNCRERCLADAHFFFGIPATKQQFQVALMSFQNPGFLIRITIGSCCDWISCPRIGTLIATTRSFCKLTFLRAVPPGEWTGSTSLLDLKRCVKRPCDSWIISVDKY